MKCEVRNTQSAETFQISPEGSTFGRTGGPANITIADQSVSKRHARIFMKDGQWFLEDLKSVNGTVVNNRRITEPVQITPGFTFSLSKHQFEVVILEPNGARSDPRRGTRPPAQPSPSGPSRSRQPAPQMDLEPILPPEASRSRSSFPAEPMGGMSREEPLEPQNDPYLDELGEDGGGASAVLAAIPSAIAYYLKNVPLMLLNPIGTVRRGAEEQPVAAMKPLALVAFAIPAYLIAMELGTFATFVGGAILGNLGIGSFITGLLINAAIAIVAGIVYGFIMHPVTRFVVEKILGGQTDERSRSNYAVMNLVVLIIFMSAGALTVLFASIIAKLTTITKFFVFLNVLPALLQGFTGFLFCWMALNWFKQWRVANWANIVIKILFALSILGMVASIVFTGILGSLAALNNPTTVDPTKIEGKDDDDKGEDKGDDKGDDKKGDDTKGDDTKADDKKGDDTKADDKKGDDAKADDKKGDDAKADDKKADDTKADDKKGDDTKAAISAQDNSPPSGNYAQKRDAIEKALTEDSTFLLKGNNLDKYTAYARCAYNQREEVRNKLGEGRKRSIPSEYTNGPTPVYVNVLNALIATNCRREIDALTKIMPK